MNCDPPTWVLTGMFLFVGLFFFGLIATMLPWAIRTAVQDWDHMVAFMRSRKEE